MAAPTGRSEDGSLQLHRGHEHGRASGHRI